MRALVYLGLAAASAVLAFLLAPLLIRHRAVPATKPIELTEQTFDPAVWGLKFPAEFEAYKLPARTLELTASPPLAEQRGHAFSLKDRDESEPDPDPRWKRILAGRPKERPVPGACLECHGSTGVQGLPAASYYAARRTIDRPVGCIDCHDPKTMQLRITRPAFARAMPAATEGVQEMRTYVCAQCHAAYYLAGETKALTLPWAKGPKLDEIEALYDELGHRDWTHAETGAAVRVARHPQFEMWTQGVHARSGVACADCHMPRLRKGAAQVSDHHVRSPLLNIESACAPCHRSAAGELQARVKIIQDRHTALLARAEDALVALIDEINRARAAGATGHALAPALRRQSQAQFRAEFAAADGSKGFHAPQEAARLLAEAIDYARRGQIAAAASARTPRGAGAR